MFARMGLRVLENVPRGSTGQEKQLWLLGRQLEKVPGSSKEVLLLRVVWGIGKEGQERFSSKGF